MSAAKTVKRTFKVIGILLLALILAVGVLTALYYGLPAKPTTSGVDFYTAKAFGSREEIEKVFKKFDSYNRTTNVNLYWGFVYKSAAPGVAVDDALNMESASGSSPDYSVTNVQVAGIDEADVVKTDGRYLYVRNTSGINIVSVKDGAMQKLSTININCTSFYIYNDYIIAIGNGVKSGTKISVYDTQNKQSPVLERFIEHSGYILTTRLMNGVLYYAVNYRVGTENDIVPRVRCEIDAELKEQEIGDIYYFDGVPNKNYITLGKLDLNDKANDGYKSYLGAGTDFYMSENNLYISSADYSERYYTNGLRTYYNYNSIDKTRILKFDLDSLEFKAAGVVNGIIKDRFCLDEYEGNLRVATTVGGSYSLVTVLDAKLNEIGKTDEIAPGESIYSCRFNGTSCSLVTFRRVDPLFKIDLTDPTAPKVSEGLKKDGVSYYLHFIEGTDYLIGLGYDTVDGVTKGIEVALFDNSGADAEIINVIVIGNSRATAEAITNPKAILYDKDRDMFGFAATVYSKNYGTMTGNYYLFGFMDGKLKLRSTITHDASMDSRYEFLETEEPYYRYNSNYYVGRAVQIGDYLYSISNRLIVSHSIDRNFKAVSTLEIDVGNGIPSED